MSARSRRFFLLLFVAAAGCSTAIREDRTIHFAADGRKVAFQHGREGVFVAETEDATPTKIFQPDADTIAVGAPLWSPTDQRLIFTTARAVGNQADARAALPAESNPAGDAHFAGPTEYICWLREEAKTGQPLNVPIFTAHCNHAGYVAANLAVRWHPDGQHLLFLDEVSAERHGLFEFDLQTRKRRRVFPHDGAALVFDWTPDGRNLVCVLGAGVEPSPNAGIWIGQGDETTWWHVPHSAQLGGGELNDLLPVRPVWTRDGSRFAFVTTRKSQDKQADRHTLYLGALEPRGVVALIDGVEPIRDLHWRPDGSRIGFLRGREDAVFHLADTVKASERVVGEGRYQSFLGWDAAGEQLAFIARQPPSHDFSQSWAFLFFPDFNARNCLLIAPDADPARTRSVFSEMQLTFARWAPTETKLSLWATFRPAYRSWLSHLLDLRGDAQDPLRGLTLRPGDPALVLDPVTGERHWKAINGHEKAQIGHYHLLRREYAEAWRWYEQSTAIDDGERSPRRFIHRFVHGSDALFFQAYCLDKLGRADEANEKRRRFVETFLPELPAASNHSATQTPTIAPFGAADLQPSKEQLLHYRDLYLGEVFLSLDAVEDGVHYFREALQNADSDAERLSNALVLTQFLLLRDRREEYAELATNTVLPLLLRTWKPRPRNTARNQQRNVILAYSDGLSLVPLFSNEFLAGLSEKKVHALVPRWRKLRSRADDDVKRLGIDLFLRAAAECLRHDEERQAAERRIVANPARSEVLGENGVRGLIEGVRAAPKMFEQLERSADEWRWRVN